MSRVLCKGNEAAVKGALLAGCRSYYGYPITPASEIAEAASKFFPLCGGTFVQAESEIGAINMCYGAASTGERTMTGSSSPGVSLMQEGLSYAAGSELPIVFVDVMRGGPGLGNIAPEQSDYNQIVKGGGHGCYKLITLAPASPQEMCDLTVTAFELADLYRNPACVLVDGFVAQMMEPVAFPRPLSDSGSRPWGVRGDAVTRDNLISSIYLAPDALEAHVRKLEAKYQLCQRLETRWEEVAIDDAELVIVAYGIVARIAEQAVEMARARGLRVGLLRPISLFPFPVDRLAAVGRRAKAMLVVELSTGMLVDDVRLAVSGTPVSLMSRVGGNVPTSADVAAQLDALAERHGLGRAAVAPASPLPRRAFGPHPEVSL